MNYSEWIIVFWGYYIHHEISKIIRSSVSKSCDLDTFCTWLLKICFYELLHAITYIVNMSLSSNGKYCWIPRSWRMSGLSPVSLIYKQIIERAVVVRLNQHLIQNGLHEVLQGTYTQNHSTETALLKIQNDLLMAFDTRPHPAWVICCIWYCRPYYITVLSAVCMTWGSDMMHFTGSDPIWDNEDKPLFSMVHCHHIKICIYIYQNIRHPFCYLRGKCLFRLI